MSSSHLMMNASELPLKGTYCNNKNSHHLLGSVFLISYLYPWLSKNTKDFDLEENHHQLRS